MSNLRCKDNNQIIYYNNDKPVKTDTSLEKLELMLGYSLGVYPETKKKKK